jgi:hypothetical protein
MEWRLLIAGLPEMKIEGKASLEFVEDPFDHLRKKLPGDPVKGHADASLEGRCECGMWSTNVTEFPREL